ncbi:U3 small nucleolar RNA-associated protein 6 [Dictyocoela muelleri]|nr:U3 small nucleolar RNA-associated protein 6 [Dictyocoela muelleri]
MHEKVQYYLEKSIPELTFYKENNIFPSQKIRSIIETRRKYEHKLNSNVKNLLDYLTAIEYEQNLENKVEKIIQNKNFVKNFNYLKNFNNDENFSNDENFKNVENDVENNFNDENKNVDKKFINIDDFLKTSETNHLNHKNNRSLKKITPRKLIIRLYFNAIYNFPDDKRLFIQFSEYLLLKNEISTLKDMLIKKCLRNMNDVFIWSYSGNILRKIDISLSRIIFQKGFRVTKNKDVLYNFVKSEIKNVIETDDEDLSLVKVIFKELDDQRKNRVIKKYPEMKKILVSD